MERVSSNILGSLTNGSGIDIQKLARDLADVEKNPRERKLLESKTQEENKISALSVLKFNVEQIIGVFQTLNDVSELATPVVSTSDSPSLSIVSTDGSATSGQHEISISSLASVQRNFSSQYTSAQQSLNGGSAFELSYSDSSGTSTVITIDAGNDTPEGVVSAINRAGTNLTASLVKESSDDSQYRIVLQSSTGSNSGFIISSDLSDADLGFHDAANGNSSAVNGIQAAQHASDAVFTVDGLTVNRSSNLVDDVISGVTINLTNTHSDSNADRLFIASDTSTLKTKLDTLVTSYNDIKFALDELSSRESANDELSGALKNDLATIRTVRDTIYKVVTSDSSATSNGVSALRDIGVTINKEGTLELDENKFDSALETSFSDVSVMLTAGTNNQSRYDEQPQGLAMDAVIKLESLTDQFSGVFATRTSSSNEKLEGIEADLLELTNRTEIIYQRYLTQFTVMETLVNQINGTRDSLSDTWKNLGLYKDK